MSGLLLLPWALLLFFCSRQRGAIIFYFVLFQFVFVGLGLIVFPIMGMDMLKMLFHAYSFSSIDANDFNFASVVMLVGVTSTVISYSLGRGISTKRQYQDFTIQSSMNRASCPRRMLILALVPITVVVSGKFILDNYANFFSIIVADSASEISESIEFRRMATSSYIMTIYVYNLLPAISLAALLLWLTRPTTIHAGAFIVLFVCTVSCLVLTYQKRPLLIYLVLVFLTVHLHRQWLLGKNPAKLEFLTLLNRFKWPILGMLTVLFVFYYFYTSYRFSGDSVETFSKILTIVFSRLFGRLSVPAAMYVDYFPRIEDYYGLANVGLFADLFGFERYSDTKTVFAHYSTKVAPGNQAASVFMDAYGQGGLIATVVYGLVVGLLLVHMDWLICRSNNGPSRIFLLVTLFMFTYYLSQASLFRSALGYGAFFYILVWIALIKNSGAFKRSR